jgi:polysaccharide export outer membrane protein
MGFGRFRFVGGGSLLAFLILLSISPLQSFAQSRPASEGTQDAPPLPAVQPLSQAASRPANQSSANDSSSNSGPQADAAKSTFPGANAAVVNPPVIRLSLGDLIEIGVYNVPELNTKARVGNSGDVYLPLIDYVHVAGLTVEEAQALMEKRLEDGGFVRNPHVTIFLDESTSEGVTILGEVSRPGIYSALGNRRLYDLISAAGGFTAAAGRKVSIIHANNSEAVTVNLPRNLADDLQDNVEIRPGDTITIPRAPVVYVVGDVGRPTGLLVDNGSLTVLQALALAGGTNHTAKLGGVKIIHKGPGGPTETRVPLKKMLEAKAPDMTLQADDILFVPLSGVRVAASQSLQAAISAATGIAVIAAHP